jgi:Fe-S-cluster containining protein
VTWTRHGTCNGCGHCCETAGRMPLVRDLAAVDDAFFYQARGFRPTLVDGRMVHVLWADLVAPCPHHGDGCRIYAERPATCQAFPVHPRDIVDTPCSYWFEADGRTAGGLGSPYPTALETFRAMEDAQ